MTASKWFSRSAFCWAVMASSFAWRTVQAEHSKKLYVEPFTTNSGGEKLRVDTIAELRKIKSISIVPDEASANMILGGGGEIWIKGYQSLNPRSGRLPSDGTPVYAGYLSVELKDLKGETLWSYLVTPGGPALDVSRRLAKQIVKHVAEALDEAAVLPRTAPQDQPRTKLQAAGATFPYPVYSKWFTNYGRENPNVEITYAAIGSEAGIRKLLAGEVDFGASDSPEVIRDLAREQQGKYILIPTVVGAVVPIVNLPGVTSDIAFTPQALAGIYLGTIKKWNDPILKHANPRVQLPNLDIVVIHRSDGSGTSYAWTDFLSKTNPEWKAEAGAGLDPKWPTGRAASGNDGVAKLVKEFGGSIGYVEYIYALRNHVSFGRVKNRNGEFIDASLESIGLAAAQATTISDDLKVSIVDAPGRGAYPIATFTWFVVPAHIADEGKRNALAGFLKWALGHGQAQAAALGYLALPKDVATKAEDAIAKIR